MRANAWSLLGTHAADRSKSHTRLYALSTERDKLLRKQEEGAAPRTPSTHCAGGPPRAPRRLWGSTPMLTGDRLLS
ncbi:hypothetical protein MLD38_040522 [Melastoma candidum]|nr:hypothetical protein MLD38_040522 [Melastoma candidum]